MANNSTSLTDHHISCKSLSSSNVAKLWAYIFLVLGSSFGNILTIIVIYVNKNIRRPLDYFIMNMAVSNMFIPCVVLPYQIIKTLSKTNYWLIEGYTGEVMCKLVFILADMGPVVSIYSLVAMTSERFVALLRGSKNRDMSVRRRIVSIWVFSLSIFTPYLYTFRLHRINNQWYCLQRWSPAFDHVTAYKVHMTILVVICIIIPFALLVAMYGVILVTLNRCVPYFRPVSKVGRKRKCKVIRTTLTQALALVIVFGICWGPYNTIVLLWGFAWNWSNFPSCSVRLLFVCAQFMTYSDSCITPLVYFMFFPRYRKAMKKILKCG